MMPVAIVRGRPARSRSGRTRRPTSLRLSVLRIARSRRYVDHAGAMIDSPTRRRLYAVEEPDVDDGVDRDGAQRGRVAERDVVEIHSNLARILEAVRPARLEPIGPERLDRVERVVELVIGELRLREHGAIARRPRGVLARDRSARIAWRGRRTG